MPGAIGHTRLHKVKKVDRELKLRERQAAKQAKRVKRMAATAVSATAPEASGRHHPSSPPASGPLRGRA
jgi:hypothetical protein